MKKQTILAGWLLLIAAITFWISWFLMPEPGTTNTAHILRIVKESRTAVFYSVVSQIISSVLYVIALFLVTRISLAQPKTLAGIMLMGIGAMGLCADAFFHLLAYYMTADTVNIGKDVVTVMDFMQTKALVFLVPLLLPFFIGSLIWANGLRKQGMLSKFPQSVFITAFFTGLIGIPVAMKIFSYNGQALSLSVLGLFAVGQAITGIELITRGKKTLSVLVKSNN